MLFKSKDISTLHFDETAQIKVEINDSLKQVVEKIKEGQISGVITYFFNDNYGDKPDIGAQVFIIDTLQIKNFNVNTVDSFYYGKTYRSLYEFYNAKGKKRKMPDNILEQVKKYGVESKEQYESLDYRTAKELMKIKNSNALKLVVDGNGKITSAIRPGIYYVLIISNNRKNISVTEISGKYKLEILKIKSEETNNFSTNFDAN